MSATSALSSAASATASPCRAAPIASSPERPCCKAWPLQTLCAELTNSSCSTRQAHGDDAAAAQRAVGIAAQPPARARCGRARHRGREERLSAESHHCIYMSRAESAAPLARQLSLRTRAFFSLAACARAQHANACMFLHVGRCMSAPAQRPPAAPPPGATVRTWPTLGRGGPIRPLRQYKTNMTETT